MTRGDDRYLHNEHTVLRRGWHPVELDAEIGTEPVAVTLLGVRYVVARLGGEPGAAGETGGLVAFADCCPHRGAPLSAGTIVDGCLQCPYHGYRFDRAGRCVDVPSLPSGVSTPARADLATGPRVATRHGIVWLAPDEPLQPIPAFGPEAGVSGDAIATPPMDFAVPASLLMENALDQAHVPFVHGAAFGARDDASNVTVDRDEWSFVVTYQQSGIAADAVFAHESVVFGYAFPFAMWGHFVYPGGGAVSFLTALQPVDADTTRAFGAFVLPAGADGLEGFMDAQVDITEEDRRMLELLPDPGLRLDVAAEVHTRADRAGVELRRLFLDAIGAATDVPDPGPSAPVEPVAP